MERCAWPRFIELHHSVTKLEAPRKKFSICAGYSSAHSVLYVGRMSEPLMILVAGPYRSGTNDDPILIQKNVDAMTDTALKLFRLGHLPVLGEWFALPMIERAGSRQIGDAVFDEIFHPVSRLLVVRCDACLRIGGPSRGADEMVQLARSSSKKVFFSLEEVPLR